MSRIGKKGQSALDLVLTFVVVLGVLVGLSSMTDSYKKAQYEISLREQAEANADTAFYFITFAGWYTHDPALGPSSAVAAFNSSSLLGGIVPLPFIRRLEKFQGVECFPQNYTAQDIISVSLIPSETGLSKTIDVNRHYVLPPNPIFVDADVHFTSCALPIEIRSGS